MPTSSSSKFKRLIERLSDWRLRNIPDGSFVFIVAFLIGIFAGLGAFLLKEFIGLISHYLVGTVRDYNADYRLLLFPLAGLLLTTLYTRYVVKADITHGTDRLIRDVQTGQFRLAPRFMYSPILACSMTIGFGGSAGAEGPIAYSGAAIGSTMGRIFKVSPRFLMILFGCGAGAAIAGIYKAPLGGALYTLEVLKLEMSTLSVVLLMMTCLVAAMVSFSLSGYVPDVSFTQHTLFEPSIIPMVLLLGVFIGFYSLYYFNTMQWIGRLLGKIGNVWLKNIVAGATLAALVFLFPALYGEGFECMIRVLGGDVKSIVDPSWLYDICSDRTLVLLVFVGLLLAKAVAVGTTNYGGGVSGNFTPALFAGCMAGMFFAMTCNHFFDTDLNTANFALMGMAGVMSGVIRAPLMAIFLTTEITQNLDLLLPITLTASISFAIVKLFSKRPFFQSQYIVQNLIEPFDVKKSSDVPKH